MKTQERFLVGNSYRRLDGQYVRFVEVHNKGTDDETMVDEHGVSRYTNDDEFMGFVDSNDFPNKESPLYTPPLFFEVQS